MFDLNLTLAAAILISVLVFYLIFFVPMRWIRKLEDLLVDKKSLKASMRTKGQKVPPPFPNGWYMIAESQEIVAGVAKSISCLGENFVVFRSKQTREVFVLDAYCPHLGANLGVGGIVKDDCIECPFHQWRFSGHDGKCVDIPYSKSLSEIEKSANLRKWISKESVGFVFVWYHAENDEPWDLPILNEVKTGRWKCHGKSEFIVNCHIQEIPENAADCTHFQTLHYPSVLGGSDIRFIRSSLLSIGTHIWDTKWRPDENNRVTALISIMHHFKLFNYEMIKSDSIMKQYGPAYFIINIDSSFGKMMILKTITPIGPLMQKFSSYFYGPRHLAWFAKFTLISQSMHLSRDVMIWNSKKFIASPLLPKEDKIIKQYRVWFNQFYSENSKSFASAKQDLSW